MHTPNFPSGTPTIIGLGPLDLDELAALIGLALSGETPRPTPRDGRTLHLIEATRPEVHAAVQALVHTEQVHDALAVPVADWEDAERASVYTGLLIEGLTLHGCTYAPVAAGMVAAWRSVVVAAIAFHDGLASFRDVTDRAKETQRLARFYSSGAFHAAIGGI